MQELQARLNLLQNNTAASSVDQALLLVRQFAARPPEVFDAYALIGALANLEDVARRSGHADIKKFTAVLSNCKKLPHTPRMGDFVTQVLGEEVEREVAKTVSKIYKSTRPLNVMRPTAVPPMVAQARDRPYPVPYNRFRSPRYPRTSRCFNCNGIGHFARDCQNLPRSDKK